MEKYMNKITKYGRRMKLFFAGAALVAGMGIMISLPWAEGFAKAEKDYYTVLVNGREVGKTASVSEAEDAYAKACTRLENESSGKVYVDSQISVKKCSAWIGGYTGTDALEDRIYSELSGSLVEAQESAYVLNVDDTSVVLASLEEVTEVVNAVKDEYDAEDNYQAVIAQSEDSRFGTATCELVQASIEPVNNPIVMASEDGEDIQQNNEEEIITFGNKIEIVETYSTEEQTVSVEEAVEAVKAALQVVSVSKETYSEPIEFATEYVTDDSQYTDYTEIIQNGQAGIRMVTAEVTYGNGVETGRTVLTSEEVQQPVAQIVKVGTKTRPEYALPLARAVISDVFGPRWGRMHWGMDFACSTGTEVLASAAGTVTEATFRNDYGYTVVISHGNGMKTRYAHMSQLLVGTGDSVNQGSVVGLSGNTGDSTGPHLHFEIILNGTRVDPQPYLYQ